VERAVAALLSAERPVIVAGGGVVTSGAWDELRALAERLSLPVATSLNAKTAFPNTHPLAAGVVGRYSRWCANRTVGEADLVLFVGTRAGGMTTWEWRVPRPGVRTIQVNIDAEEIGRNYPAEVALLGDAKLTLAALTQAAPSRPAGEWTARVQRHVAEWRAEYAELRASDATPMRPERLCAELERWLPQDTLLVADTGHAGIWTSTMIDIDRTGNNYLRAAGSLGWALPATIGAKCGAPERPVVCFTGDGGFYYHIAELETAVRHGIAPVIVVNDNASLNQEWGPLRQTYGGEPPAGAMELMAFTNVNLADVAAAMGCHAERVERPQDLRPALDRALAAGRIAVLDVVTDMTALGPTAREFGPE
jgi:acetolactate synthase-1/2/3 large subunit